MDHKENPVFFHFRASQYNKKILEMQSLGMIVTAVEENPQKQSENARDMSGGEDTTDMSTEEVKEIQRSGLKSE